MCEVLDRIVAEGENQGEERGERKANLAAIKNIMKKFNMTAQEAMETLDISKADFKMYMSLLQVILFRGKKLVEESASFFAGKIK